VDQRCFLLPDFLPSLQVAYREGNESVLLGGAKAGTSCPLRLFKPCPLGVLVRASRSCWGCQWTDLAELFQRDLAAVYGVTRPSPFLILLQAGLCAQDSVRGPCTPATISTALEE